MSVGNSSAALEQSSGNTSARYMYQPEIETLAREQLAEFEGKKTSANNIRQGCLERDAFPSCHVRGFDLSCCECLWRGAAVCAFVWRSYGAATSSEIGGCVGHV